MNCWLTGNGYMVVRILDKRSNVYLIVKDGVFALVDTGKTNAREKLLKRLTALLSDDLTRLSTLILTHTHYDHCQSAFFLKQLSNCEIVVSANAEKFIARGFTTIPKGTLLLTDAIANLGILIGKRFLGYQKFAADRFITEDTILNIQSCALKIMNTPGHSVDSVSILIDDEIAIVGDTMFGKFKNSVYPPFADNVSEMVESWGKLLQTDCMLFLPGHGRAIKRSLLQKEYDKYKER